MSVVVVADQVGGSFSPKDPGGTNPFYWDFTSKLAVGETIISAVVTATSKLDQTDNSTAMVSGAATFAGPVVKQDIAAGVLGVTYTLKCSATTNLGNIYPLSADLPIAAVFGIVA